MKFVTKWTFTPWQFCFVLFSFVEINRLSNRNKLKQVETRMRRKHPTFSGPYSRVPGPDPNPYPFFYVFLDLYPVLFLFTSKYRDHLVSTNDLFDIVHFPFDPRCGLFPVVTCSSPCLLFRVMFSSVSLSHDCKESRDPKDVK